MNTLIQSEPFILALVLGSYQMGVIIQKEWHQTAQPADYRHIAHYCCIDAAKN